MHDASRAAPTFHLVRRSTWERLDPQADYAPDSLAREGFIHCTEGVEELALTADCHFGPLDEELLALELDRARIAAPIRYDDPRRMYPHIYGALNRDAIVAIHVLRPGPEGRYLPALEAAS